MAPDFWFVDAFTDTPFGGNPAAVCLLDRPRPADWMRRIAAEMRLSETAFLLPEDDGFSLRWFTPVTEVDLCGHATLASAHALGESGRLPHGAVVRFHTRSGVLSARRDGDWIVMDFPSLPFTAGPIPPEVVRALDVRPALTGTCGPLWLVEVADEAVVRDLRPDVATLRSLPGRGLIVTARAEPGTGCDIVSRYFAPWVGVDEDPVTGSAHCCLAPFWCARLGKTDLDAVQASPRGGRLRLHLADGRVELAGRAVTVVRGSLLV